jgi:hypothetical protein
VVDTPRVSGLGFGSRMRDTAAGRDCQAREISRLKEWCRMNGVPFPEVESAS